jgi:type VI secretion system secreted protein VgrG
LLLGKDGKLTITRTSLERRLTGIVTAFEHLPATEDDHTRVSVTVEPALALLGYSRNSRIFQDKSVDEILDEVLGEALGAYGRSHELSLDGSYPKREYCLQYKESDLAFVSRLMEEEGISYAFEHDGETEKLVLRDRNSFAAAPTAESTVPYSPRTDAPTDEMILRAVRKSVPVTTKVTIRDHDWTAPSTAKEGDNGEDGREFYEFGLGRSLTMSAYGGDGGDEDGARLAELRLQGLARDAKVIDGRSRVIGLGEGLTFQLADHSSALDGEYVLMEVEHRLGDAVNEFGDDPYVNRFRAIVKDVPYRPLRVTPKPRVPSLQTAIVTGPAGEEIHTDQHGRIKVQFHWDLAAPGDDTSSCWVRVQQPWSGAGWGIVFIPRIGMEVGVHFLNGDPDRPEVHGCLYNSDHAPPYALPDEKTKSTIKSNSSPGGGGFNEWRFEDKAGSEQIYLHAQKDLDEVVLNNHTTQVGGDQTNHVHKNQKQTIDVDQTETVDGNQTMTVDGNRTVKVTGPFKETIISGERRKVKGAESEQILSGGEKRIILGKLDEHFKSTETRVVIGGQKEIIVGDHTQTIASPHTDAIVGALTHLSVGAYTFTSTGGTFLADSGSAVTLIGAAGGTVSASTITIACTERIEMDPHAFKWKPFDFSSIGSKITQVNVAIDIAAALSLEAYGAKAEAWAIAAEIFKNKLSIIGAKIDISLIKPKLGGSKFQFAFKILG